MKVTRVFTYDEGPWYTPVDAMHLLGHKSQVLTDMLIKVMEYEKRRLFALEDLTDRPFDDNEFLHVLTKAFSTMAGSLVQQYRAWESTKPKKIRSISVINSQGIPKPGYPEILRELLGFNGIPVYHMTGMNCGSSLLALQHLYRLRKKQPLRGGECDLVFSVEAPSTTLRRKRNLMPIPFFTYDLLISDGAALVVIEPSDSGPGLEVVGHHNFLYPTVQDNLLSRPLGNQIEHGTSPQVVEDLVRVIKSVVSDALSHLNLSQEQIKHWVIHPAGVVLVKGVMKALELKDGTMNHCFDTVRSQGNTMSSLILYALRRYLDSHTYTKNDLAMLITMAPGFEIQTVTVRHA